MMCDTLTEEGKKLLNKRVRELADKANVDIDIPSPEEIEDYEKGE